MNEKDGQILEDSVDVIISSIPALGIAWGLSKALFGAGLKLRKQRALEWVEMVRDNPNIFVKEVLETEEFQDGFVFSLEKYLVERNEEKRKYLRKIFLNYSKTQEKNTFELEKFFHVLSQLTVDDIFTLKYIQLNNLNSYQVFNDRQYFSNINNLINLGILHNDPASRLGSSESPWIYNAPFGTKFIKYLKYEN